LGAKEGAEVDVITVADTQKAMENVITGFSLSSAFSSAALTCRPLGDGLDVTTINITQITPAMFAMALVTAGVGDATLTVAAPASAPAQGMTALTGIFQAWDKVSCESAQTTKARQQLALRELALTVEISTAIGEAQTGYAGAFVIDTQRNIVTNKFKSRDEITAAIVQQEGIYGFTVPEPSRTKLIDLMVDLAGEKIDWSTFAAGWTIEYPTGTSIQMRGDGIAIQNAQASATARAARAQKRMTQTAIAADKTATALAQPSPTATATAVPIEFRGELESEVTGNSIRVRDDDGKVQVFELGDDLKVTRNSEAALVQDLVEGDALVLMINPVTQQVLQIAASAPAKEGGTPIAKLAIFLPVLLLIPLGMIVKGRSGGDPFVVKRVARD
jgi:hypothetical protein